MSIRQDLIPALASSLKDSFKLERVFMRNVGEDHKSAPNILIAIYAGDESDDMESTSRIVADQDINILVRTWNRNNDAPLKQHLIALSTIESTIFRKWDVMRAVTRGDDNFHMNIIKTGSSVDTTEDLDYDETVIHFTARWEYPRKDSNA